MNSDIALISKLYHWHEYRFCRRKTFFMTKREVIGIGVDADFLSSYSEWAVPVAGCFRSGRLMLRLRRAAASRGQRWLCRQHGRQVSCWLHP